MTGAIYSWLLETTLKGSILIVIVAVIQRLIAPRVDARWRHLLWVIVLVRLVLPVAPASSFSLFNLIPAAEPVSLPRVVSVQPAPAAGAEAVGETVRVRIEPSRSGVPWLVGIWLCGVVAFAARAAIAAARMRRAIAGSRETGAQSPIPVVECDAIRTPALHGVLRPVLLLPRGFTASFSDAELRHVVLHEMWHVRRMDVAVSWLLAVAQCVHWFNPLVWFAGARIREERELACDELALSLLEEEERPDYGRTILKLIERFRPASPLPAVVGIVDRKERMKRRLTMIASFQTGTRFTALFLMLAGAVGLAGLTDGEVRHRKFMKTIDPAAHATVEKLRQRVSFELSGASLADLLNTISNETGLPITQDPQIATLPVQDARFTIDADNVPARIVLAEALLPFQLIPQPTASGVTIARGEARHMRIVLPKGEAAEVGAGKRKKVVFVERKAGEHPAAHIEADIKADLEAGVEERVIVRAHASADDAHQTGTRRNLQIELDENGVKSQGTLSIQID